MGSEGGVAPGHSFLHTMYECEEGVNNGGERLFQAHFC